MTRSDDAPLLAPGIYEALLTRRLRERLPGGEGLVRTDIVELADAPSVLAHHVSGVIELLLRSPDMDGDLERQVDLCNRLIAELAKDPAVSAIASGETVDQNGRELVEVLRSSDSPLAAVRPLPRPTTRLDQNALFVSAKQEPALASELYRELESADRVDLLCAFLVWSGVRVLLDPLKRARARGVPIRVITTTYTGITDARAPDELEKLGAEIKVSYDTGVTRLHAKAWLFERESEFSTAYIGSSNLTHTALHDGLEWNVRLTQSLSRDLLARFRAAFETYWADPGFETYQQDTFRAAI
jgi:HKD family nuclease